MANNPFLSDAAANAAASAVTALCNGGSIKVYSGSQPANANAAVAGTLLASLALSATAFGAPAAGVATANAITPATAAATGTATWFRAFKSDGTTAVYDGSVGTASADLVLSSTSIVAGGQVSVSAFTYTQTE